MIILVNLLNRSFNELLLKQITNLSIMKNESFYIQTKRITSRDEIKDPLFFLRELKSRFFSHCS